MPKSPDTSGDERQTTSKWYERLGGDTSFPLGVAMDNLNNAQGRSSLLERLSDFYSLIVGGPGIWNIISKEPFTRASEDLDPHLLFQGALAATCNLGDLLDPNNISHHRMNRFVGFDISQAPLVALELFGDFETDPRIEPIATRYFGVLSERNVEDQVLHFYVVSASGNKETDLTLATCERAVISLEVGKRDSSIQTVVVFLERADENSQLQVVKVIDGPLEMMGSADEVYQSSENLFGIYGVGKHNRTLFLEGMERVRTDEYKISIHNIHDDRVPISDDDDEKQAA